MQKNILITGKDTYIGNELCKDFLSRGQKVLATVESAKHPPAGEENLTIKQWNPLSSISAKNLVLDSRNDVGPLDTAIIVFSPAKSGIPFDQTSFRDIETGIDQYIKGRIFLCKEVYNHMIKQGKGALIILIYEENAEKTTPLESSYFGAIRSFCESLLKERQLDMYVIDSTSKDPELFLDYLQNTLKDTKKNPPGKYYRHSDKRGFFALHR